MAVTWDQSELAEVARVCRSGPAYAPPAAGSLVDRALEQPVREHRHEDATLAHLAAAEGVDDNGGE